VIFSKPLLLNAMGERGCFLALIGAENATMLLLCNQFQNRTLVAGHRQVIVIQDRRQMLTIGSFFEVFFVCNIYSLGLRA